MQIYPWKEIEIIHFEAFSQNVAFLKKKLNYISVPEFSDVIHFEEYLEYWNPLSFLVSNQTSNISLEWVLCPEKYKELNNATKYT